MSLSGEPYALKGACTVREEGVFCVLWKANISVALLFESLPVKLCLQIHLRSQYKHSFTGKKGQGLVKLLPLFYNRIVGSKKTIFANSFVYCFAASF